jgi:hypothetical protein
MSRMRLGLVLISMLVVGAGCSIGAPERASNIQNPNAIPDDISSVNMARPEAQKVQDPNLPTTLPTHYQLPQE